jgi:hypothetical protein
MSPRVRVWRWWRWLWAGLALLPGTVGAAGPGFPSVRLVSPALEGGKARLAPGDLIPLAWEAEGGLPSEVEEWEAFLSLDGGATWPVRITPHLDVAKRQFLWRVPYLPSRAARLLLRFGDERREREVEVPGTFAIAEGSHRFRGAAAWEGPELPTFRRGEKARPRDPRDRGTALWTEGRRDGSRLLTLADTERPEGFQSTRPALAWLWPVFAPGPSRTALLPPRPTQGAAPVFSPPSASGTAPGARRPTSVRLLIGRFNE